MNFHDEIAPLVAAYEMKVLPPARRAEVEQHLLECDLCFEDAYSFSPVAQQILKTRTEQSVSAFSSRWRLARFALAACLMTVVLTGYWIFDQTPAQKEDRTRGAVAVELVSPRENQTLSFPVIFRWKAKPAASFYRFHLWSEHGPLIEGERVEPNSYVWRADVPLESGEYRWSVEACLSDGTKIAGSHIRSFVLK